MIRHSPRLVCASILFLVLLIRRRNDVVPRDKNKTDGGGLKGRSVTTSHIDYAKTRTYFSDKKKLYDNKADFDGIKRLVGILNELGLASSDSVVMLGGTNNGQLSYQLLQLCPSITFYGFEIQEEPYLSSTVKLKGFENVHLINAGWDEAIREGVQIGGHGENAGLFDPRQRNWELQKKTVSTVALSSWAKQHNIHQTIYVVIDTEGHEPKVIRGMKLDNAENQRRFPLFQYEQGGTWAERDSRHNNDPWTQLDTAQHLQDNGYMLFMIGATDWLQIDAEFFDLESHPAKENEGHGDFIQGNCLAMHKKFTRPNLMAKILTHVHTEKQL